MATPSKVDENDKTPLRSKELTPEEKKAQQTARNLERFNRDASLPYFDPNAPPRPKKLTPEQKKALEDAQKLTPEQKKALKDARKRTRGKRIRLQLRL